MIPKIIHQIWTKPTIDAQRQNSLNSMRNLNKDWRHVIWTTHLMRGYLARRHKDWLPLWDSINPTYGVIYAVVFRYIILHDVGGVYLDVKSLITQPLDKLLNLDAQAYLAGDRTNWLQWFLISSPRDPILAATMRRVFLNLETYEPHRCGVGRNATLNLAGPTPYTQAVNWHLNGGGNPAGYVVLNPLPHWLIYDTIGMQSREADGSHYSTQTEALLWP